MDRNAEDTPALKLLSLRATLYGEMQNGVELKYTRVGPDAVIAANNESYEHLRKEDGDIANNIRQKRDKISELMRDIQLMEYDLKSINQEKVLRLI